ncbi:MAG: Cys-Gln thioester bond-forming surface protein, partial [Erysipelothrix sp.]|nr:Cys-Gln thioester bond-forming surface protein [Erysipelothrix sp.]
MKRKLKQGLIAIAITLMMVMLLTPAQAQTINITFEKTGVIATGTARSENSQGYALWWGAGHNWDYIKVNGEIAFCIEPEIQLKPESSYTESSFSHADRETFSRIIYHGYDSNPTAENYTLTQLTLWEYIASIRSDLTVTSFKNLGVPQYEAKRDALMAKVSKHSITASFAGSTISLNVGETLKITDNNGVLANSAITDKGGLETSINGNSLSVKALTSSPLTSKITLKKYSDITGNASVSPILYASTDSQNVIAKGNPNPVIYTVNVTINDKGNLEIVKLNEVGQPIPNTVFTLSKNSDMSQPIGTYTTGTNGKVTVSNIVFGSYYVQEKQVPSPLLLDSTIKRIEITAGQTASFSHTNKAAQGQIVVTKSSNEGLLENTVFEIRNSNNVLVETIKTNSDGRAQSSLLPLGKYTLKEVTASPGYVLDDTVYEVELKYKDQLTPLVTQSFSLSNKLIEGRIRVVKTDGVTSLPVEGVVFNVLSLPEREPIETIVSDSEGFAISSSLPYGEYVIVEEDSPVEYYLNENEYVVAIKENGKTEEVVITNDPVLMKLQLIKSDHEDETKVLPGVVFEVLNDQEEVMFTLTTDELGQALSQESLPYGTYRLREVKAAPGYVLGDDVYFEINRDTEFIEIEEVRVLSLNLNNNQTTTTVSKVDIHG